MSTRGPVQGLRRFFRIIFQWDKDWETRVLMVSVVFGIVWAVVGGADALLVRLQESSYALSSTLVTPPWDYYAGLTLHATRELFGFGQQVEMGVLVFLTVKLLGKKPKAGWLIWAALILINASIFLFEGPVLNRLSFIDSYFSGAGWDSLAPLGVPGYSQYVVSPAWWLGWLALELSTVLWGAWWVIQMVSKPRPKSNYVLYFVSASTLLYLSGYWAPIVSTNWELLTPILHLPLNTLYNQTVFWFYGHSVVYMLFLPAVTALYYLVPTLLNRPVYSEPMAKYSAVLYLIASNIVPIHHLYNTVYPYWVNLFQEVLTYLVVVPSVMTFFNLFATAKGVGKISWSVPAAFVTLSFAGAIGAGVTGVANATVSFDEIIHNTMWVPGHFHAMIDLMILPAAFALLYVLVPAASGRVWFSPKLGWLHFWLTMIGGAGMIVFFDDLGLIGILRRSMIFPRTGSIIVDEVGATVFALIFGVGQIFFLYNAVATLYRGRRIQGEGLTLVQLTHLAAASTSLGSYSVPEPSAKPGSESAKRRAELTWTGIAIFLLAAAAVSTLPYAVTVGGNIQNVPSIYLQDPPAVLRVSVTAYQYFWLFTESGIPNSTVNFFTVNPGQRVLFNGTAANGNALANFYMPIFSDRVLNNELYQEYHSLLYLTAPNVPGVYGFMNGEYNGPFYTYMGGEMVVMPPGGVLNNSQVKLYGEQIVEDPYTPAAEFIGKTVGLSMSETGMWNNSDPGPTLLAAEGGNYTLQFDVTLRSLVAFSNYLFNVTSANMTAVVQHYLSESGGRLPFTLELLHVYPNGVVRVETQITPKVGVNSLTFQAGPGIYVYGLVQPVSYSFNPYGTAGYLTGADSGRLTSLWGTVLVYQP
ncbi:MAG: cbb3-type cytochrome c oxidase subunit I [Thermoprotei archaeon]